MLIWSLLAGLISGVCWLLGDILLVGFEVDKERYGSFVSDSPLTNPDMALLMLSGSEKRLRLGALLAHFSIPFMLFSLYGLLELTNKSVWAYLSIMLLGIGFSLSPVAHVAFYYVGRTSQAAFEQAGGTTCSLQDAQLINDFTRILDVTWRSAIVLTALGWLGYSVLIFSGQTSLPFYLGLLTPLFGSFLAIFLVEKLGLGRPYLNGAGLNMALTFFFILVLQHVAMR